MSGLVKAKKYDWKDSNLALFGSDVEKKVKKESAESEPAWQGAGKAVGIQVWRIVKFEVTHWPKEDYGKFFSGDSYIILNTYKEEDGKELKYDLHFWIGKKSSQDEYGTAAYKTVELDTFLNDAAIQHREVQGHESALFKGYFKTMTVMEGGAASGFRHVKPEEYQPRLLQFKGEKKRVKVTQVPMCRSKIHTGDVFILDLGLEIYIWRGKECNKDEKLKSIQYLQQLKSERHGKSTTFTLDEGEDDEVFFEKIDQSPEEDDDDDDDDDGDNTMKLFRVSDADGELKQELVKEGSQISRSLLDSKDVFIVDTCKDLVVWIGRRASKDEKKNGLTYAHKYLTSTSHPLIPVTVVKENQQCPQLNIALSA